MSSQEAKCAHLLHRLWASMPGIDRTNAEGWADRGNNNASSNNGSKNRNNKSNFSSNDTGSNNSNKHKSDSKIGNTSNNQRNIKSIGIVIIRTITVVILATITVMMCFAARTSSMSRHKVATFGSAAHQLALEGVRPLAIVGHHTTAAKRTYASIPL